MIIMNNNHEVMANLDHVEEIFLCGNSIKVAFASHNGCEIAKYSTKEQAVYALGMLYQSISGDDRCFKFPGQGEIQERLNAARVDRSHVKTKENRHGGS
jgi:hypothetical protein